MQISLNQAELEVGVKMFIQSRGIDLTGRELNMDFTQTRKGQDAGVNVEVDLGEDSVYIPDQLSTPTSPSSVTLVPNRNGGFSARRTPAPEREYPEPRTSFAVQPEKEEESEKANVTVEVSEDGHKELVMQNDTDSTEPEAPVEETQEAFAQEEEEFENPNVWYHKPETKEVWEEPETTRRKGIYKVNEDTAYRLIDDYAAEKEQAEEKQVAETESETKDSEPDTQEAATETQAEEAPFNPFASPASEVEEPKAPTKSPFGGFASDQKEPETVQPAKPAPSLFSTN